MPAVPPERRRPPPGEGRPGAESRPRAESRPGAESGGGGSELVAAVSHELRQPLASIRGFTEMVLAHWDDFSDQEKLQMLGEVLHEAKRLGRLVDELLEGSRLDGGRLVLNLKPTAMDDVVARALRNVEQVFPGMQARNELSPDLPTVVADPFKLEQVVGNIVENACKYGNAATVTVTAAPVESGSGPAVAVTISDRGPGMGPEVLARATEKFFRAPCDGRGGLGLGLWISKGIVEAHGGELQASSAPGQGTSVTFTIPLRPGPKAGKLAGT